MLEAEISPSFCLEVLRTGLVSGVLGQRRFPECSEGPDRLQRKAAQLLGAGPPSFSEMSLPSAASAPASGFGSSRSGCSPGFWDSPTTLVLLLVWHPMSLGSRGPRALGCSEEGAFCGPSRRSRLK